MNKGLAKESLHKRPMAAFTSAIIPFAYFLVAALITTGCKQDDSISYEGCAYAKLGADSSDVLDKFRRDGFVDSVADYNLVSLHNRDKKLFIGVSEGKISSVQIKSGYDFQGITIPGGILQDIRRIGINDSVCHNYEDDEDGIQIYPSDSSTMIYFVLNASDQNANMRNPDESECYSSFDSTAKISLIGIFPQR